MTKFAVILPAAGNSTRFKTSPSAKKKVFAELGGRPVWVRTAEYFVNREDVAQTIIAVSPEDLEWFKEKFRANMAFMNIDVIAGGTERCDTVSLALQAVRPGIEYVAVHDAARPLLTKAWIDSVFTAAEKHGAAILATPITSTLKLVDDASHKIVKTVPRSQTWAAQTPQVFRRSILEAAYAKRGSQAPTDEAQLVENAGGTVVVMPSSGLNLKITTAEDLQIAEALLSVLPREKTLKSLHPFASEDPRFL